MSDAEAIVAAVEGRQVQPSGRTNEDALHDFNLPAIVRGFLAINFGNATETMAIREAGFMPRLYATYCGERVRVAMVSRLGDVGINRKDEDYGYFARVSIYDLTDFGEELNPGAPADRPFVKQYAIADGKGFWVRPWNGLADIIELLPSATPHLFAESAKAHRVIRNVDRFDLKGFQVIPLLLTKVKA